MTEPAAPRSGTAAPLAWCVLAAALFGASTPAAKSLVGAMNALVLSGLLYIGAAFAVAPWALRGWGALRSADRRNLWRLAGAVVFGGAVGPVLLLLGLAMAPAGSVSLWLNLETVATALLARLFFREHLGAAAWIAVGLIVAASAMLAPAVPDGGMAALLVALACLCWGLDNNLTAVIDRFTPAQVTFAKGVIAGSVNLALGLILGEGSLEAARVAAGLGIGALGYGASILLYIGAAQNLGATRSQIVFSTAPAWGLLSAWGALGEPVHPMQLGAAGLMGLAVWVWQRERHDHRHMHERMTHRHWHRHGDGHHDHAHGVPVPPGTWHSHEHSHEPMDHTHPHRPDLHHRHEH